MPQLKASKTALRVTKRRTVLNKKIKDSIRASINKVRKTAAAGKKEEAASELKALTSKLDKAVKKKVIKKNTAGRYKARLTKLVAKSAK